MTPDERDRLAKVEQRVENQAEDIREIKSDVKEILAAINQAKGAWKLYVAIGTVSGAIGAAVAKLAPLLGKG